MNLTIDQMQKIQLQMLRIVADVCEEHNIPYLLHAGNLLGAVRHGGPIPWDVDTNILVPENYIDKFYQYCQPALSPKYKINYHKFDKNSKSYFPIISISGYSFKMCHIDVFRLSGFPSDEKIQKSMYRKAHILCKLIEIKRRKRRDTFTKTIVLYLLKPALFFIPFNYLLKQYDKLCAKYPYDKAPYAGYLTGRYGIKNMFKREIFDDSIKIKYADISIRTVRDFDFYLKRFYGQYMKLPPENEREQAMNTVYTLKEEKR